jgi:feruloyl-CoA synthase
MSDHASAGQTSAGQTSAGQTSAGQTSAERLSGERGADEHASSEHGRAYSLFAAPVLVTERRGDGSWLLRSAVPLAGHDVSVLASLRRWAAVDPDYPLVAERDDRGDWRTRTYGEMAAATRAVGQGLIELGLRPDRPLLVLSGNSVDHLVITLAAMTGGIPVIPVSAAYSLQSRDHARIAEIARLVRPGAVFAADADQFGAALTAVRRAATIPTTSPTPVTPTPVTPTASTTPATPTASTTLAIPATSTTLSDIPVIVSRGGPIGATRLADLAAVPPGREVDAAFAAIEAGSIAKILFTSGSTGTPRGVLNTHGMLAANQQMIRQAWPFLTRERPVVVDWLPWSHTFGGNHNVNLVLVAGGTLYLDAGRPVPGMFAQTLANLADVPPTIYFNVPAGYAQLVPALETDPDFARRFFARLRLIFNAAAALPAGLRQRLEDAAVAATGQPVPVTGSWGLTETAPAVTSAHFDYTDPACIGVPLPGAEVKLSPVPDGYEIRARGPMVTPGYLGRPDLTRAAFDDEGFYRTGDAVRLLDEDHPELGLAFRGRLAEDFKLLTGTFVRVGAVRTALLSAIPLLSDAVIAGEGRGFVTVLAWLNATEARRLLDRDPAADGDVITDRPILEHLAAALGRHRPDGGSAGRVERLIVVSRPPDLDGGEITDKGYLNQRRVLRLRAGLVERLYADPPGPEVVAPRY